MKRFIWLMLIATINLSLFIPVQAKTWTAQWIWVKERFTEPNSWVALRKEVELDKVPSESLAYISADTKYWLWINGELVIFEGSYTGGPSPVKPSPRVDFYPIASNKYYDTVDISPYLKKGKNTIAALAWYYGDDGQKGTHISSNKGGFIFEAKVGNTLIATDETWKAQTHNAYKKVEKKSPYRIAAWSINYDARNDMQDWTKDAWYTSHFNDERWPNAHPIKQPPRPPFFDLFPSEIPPLVNYGLSHCTNFSEESFPFISDGTSIQCKLDFNKNFTPYFDIEADEGKVIRVASNMRLNTIETLYTTKSGRQQFEGYSWSNGRTIEFSIPKGVKVHALKYRWTGVGKTPGYFESDDAWLNRIWQMAENTLYICARDNFMDTPDRERGLWIGDVADQASYLFYSMDQAGRDLLKKAIKVTLAFSDTESGIFAGLGPGRFRELPAQSLQFIEQGIWQYYYNTGDVETLSYAYPFVHKYLLLWDIKQNGLPTFRTGDWKWTDWGPQETIDYDVIQTALYYSALVAARKMASELDRDENLAFYNARIESIRLAFQKEFWQNGYFSSDKMFKDDRANAVAILFDLALPTQFQQIVDNVLVPNHYASPHFEWMIYNAMAKAGRYKDAIARMKERYGPQVDNPELSTLAEYLPARGTENHAWNAPSTVLSKHIAGVKPTSVAWKSYEIMPNLAHLTKVSQLIPSVKGDILFKLEFDNDTLNIVLNSPAKTTAEIGVPKILTKTSQILFNGKEVWSNGSERNEIPGIKFVEESNDYFIFSVKPGNWDILAR